MRDLLLWLEQRDVQACVLVDGDRALPPIGRSNRAQFAKLPLARERLLLVSGLNSILFRQDPDLQQVNGICFGGVAFAVADAAAGAHALPITRTDHGAGAKRILVLDRAFQDISDDLHVAMGVWWEARAAGDAVLIDDAQGAK